MLIKVSPSYSFCYVDIYSREVFHYFIQFISFHSAQLQRSDRENAFVSTGINHHFSFFTVADIHQTQNNCTSYWLQ